MQNETIQRIQDVSSNVTYTGAGGAVFFGFAAEFWGVVFGLVIGLAGLLVNWYYKHKAHKLLEKEYAQRGIVEDE
jgi:hypothetical protein